MDRKALEARRAYQRDWRRRNPEKVRRSQERYWTKKARELEKQQQETQRA